MQKGSRKSVLHNNDLGIGCLAFHRGNGVVVTGQRVNLRFGPHVPHPGRAVSSAGDQYVQGGVEVHGVYGAQVTVVVAHHLCAEGVEWCKLEWR